MSAHSLAADVLVTSLTVIVAGALLGWWAGRRNPDPLASRDRASRLARHRAQDDRDLLRLARNQDRRRRRAPVQPTTRLTQEN